MPIVVALYLGASRAHWMVWIGYAVLLTAWPYITDGPPRWIDPTWATHAVDVIYLTALAGIGRLARYAVDFVINKVGKRREHVAATPAPTR